MNDERILRCAFCDAEYPSGTTPTQHAALIEHIRQCDKHPLRARIIELEEMNVEHVEDYRLLVDENQRLLVDLRDKKRECEELQKALIEAKARKIDA